MCWSPLFHHVSTLLSHWNIKEISKQLKDILNPSRNTSAIDLMFLASTCKPYDQQTVSKIKISGIILLKDQVNQEVNNKASTTFTVMSQILWCYISSGKHGFIWRGDCSSWTLPRSIQIILELLSKNYPTTAFSIGKQVVREALAIFSPYQPDALENAMEVGRTIISFPRTQKNMLLLNLNLLFSWRNTALGCISLPRKLQVPMYDFIICLWYKHCYG